MSGICAVVAAFNDEVCHSGDTVESDFDKYYFTNCAWLGGIRARFQTFSKTDVASALYNLQSHFEKQKECLHNESLVKTLYQTTACLKQKTIRLKNGSESWAEQEKLQWTEFQIRAFESFLTIHCPIQTLPAIRDSAGINGLTIRGVVEETARKYDAPINEANCFYIFLLAAKENQKGHCLSSFNFMNRDIDKLYQIFQEQLNLFNENKSSLYSMKETCTLFIKGITLLLQCINDQALEEELYGVIRRVNASLQELGNKRLISYIDDERLNFEFLFNKERFHDVTIRVGEKVIHAHSIVLFRAGLFRDFFDFYRVGQREIPIKNFPDKVVEMFIQYLYTNKKELLTDEVKQAADFFQFDL